MEKQETVKTPNTVKVGELFPVPENVNTFQEIGAYTIGVQVKDGENHLVVVGKKIVDISDLPIEDIAIRIVTKSTISGSKFEKVFDLGEDTIYTMVIYGEYGWLFEHLSEANEFMLLLYSFKAEGFAFKYNLTFSKTTKE